MLAVGATMRQLAMGRELTAKASTVLRLALAVLSLAGCVTLSASLGPAEPHRPVVDALSAVVSPTDGKTVTPPMDLVAVATPTTVTFASTSTPVPTPVSLPEPTPKPQPRSQPVAAGSVPVLMYHYIRVNPDPADKIGFGLSVTPRDFEAQIAFLAQKGYRTITLRQLSDPAALQGRAVAITFDDGYADAYETAFPILKKYGFKATFYVITSLLGRPRYMTWEQARELAAAGNVIGSHTLTHPDLSQVGLTEARRQLGESKAEIERQVGQPVLDFCYPSGRYTGSVAAAVKEAGYSTAVTTRYGWHASAESAFEISRLRVSGGSSLGNFAAALTE